MILAFKNIILRELVSERWTGERLSLKNFNPSGWTVTQMQPRFKHGKRKQYTHIFVH